MSAKKATRKPEWEKAHPNCYKCPLNGKGDSRCLTCNAGKERWTEYGDPHTVSYDALFSNGRDALCDYAMKISEDHLDDLHETGNASHQVARDGFQGGAPCDGASAFTDALYAGLVGEDDPFAHNPSMTVEQAFAGMRRVTDMIFGLATLSLDDWRIVRGQILNLAATNRKTTRELAADIDMHPSTYWRSVDRLRKSFGCLFPFDESKSHRK